MMKNIIDELYSAAINLVEARHVFVQYSSPYHAELIYNLIMSHSYIAIAESLAAFFISNTIEVIGVGAILNRLIVAGNFYLMLEEINPIANIRVTAVSSQKFLKSVKDILYESATRTLRVLQDIQIPSLNNIRGQSTSRAMKDFIIKRLPFFSIGGTLIAFGRLYLNVLENYIKSEKTVIPADEMMVQIIDFYKNDKEFQNLADKSTCHMVQSFLDGPTGNSIDEITNIITRSSTDRIKFLNILESMEIRHVMSLYSSIESMSLFIMNDEASSIIIVANYHQESLNISNIFKYKNHLSTCCNAHIDMIHKFISLDERYPKVSIKNIPMQYSKYVTDEIELPAELTCDYTSAEYYMLKSNTQCIECLIQAMQIILLKRSVYPQYSICEITVLWTFMMSDILCLIYDDTVLKTKINEYTPVLISFIISCFSSESSMMYSESQINTIKRYCISQYSADKLNDILKYFPTYFRIIQDNAKYNVDDSRKLVNHIITEYLGNILIQAAQDNDSAEVLIQKLSIFQIEKEGSNLLYKIYRLL